MSSGRARSLTATAYNIKQVKLCCVATVWAPLMRVSNGNRKYSALCLLHILSNLRTSEGSASSIHERAYSLRTFCSRYQTTLTCDSTSRPLWTLDLSIENLKDQEEELLERKDLYFPNAVTMWEKATIRFVPTLVSQYIRYVPMVNSRVTFARIEQWCNSWQLVITTSSHSVEPLTGPSEFEKSTWFSILLKGHRPCWHFDV